MKPRPSLQQLQARAIAASSAPEPAFCTSCLAPLTVEPPYWACCSLQGGKLRGCGARGYLHASGARVVVSGGVHG